MKVTTEADGGAGEKGHSDAGVCWTHHENQVGRVMGAPRAITFSLECRGRSSAEGTADTSAASPLSTWLPRPRTHRSRRGSGAESPGASENPEARGTPSPAPEPS